MERKLRAARNEKLPNETGGVLIGSFDMARKVIYVVDATEAPVDSQECPNGFLRGLEGLREEVDAIQEATSGMLGYIGEWHSHPARNVAPSLLDLDVVKWVKRNLDDEGQVGVVGIVGSKQRLNLIPCGNRALSIILLAASIGSLFRFQSGRPSESAQNLSGACSSRRRTVSAGLQEVCQKSSGPRWFAMNWWAKVDCKRHRHRVAIRGLSGLYCAEERDRQPVWDNLP